MALTLHALASLSAFKARKAAQWNRIAGSIPGLQLVISGEQATQFMLVCSQESFYEGVIIGQLPHVVMERAGHSHRPVPEARKPLERRDIDLSDEHIDQISAHWRDQRSALSLAFVAAVFGANGRPQPR